MKEIKYTLLLFVVALCFYTEVHGQFTRLQQTFNLPANSEGMYGNGISMVDFNDDGLDDLTIGTNGSGVHTYVNNTTVFDEVFLLEEMAGDIKSVIWVDYDNDDDPDFFCTIFGGGCKLYRNEGELTFTNVTDSLHLPNLYARSFGAAWGDFNNDGFLDVYVANYDFILPGANTNWLFRNNGDGSFSEVASTLGVANSWKATFQPVWIDLNHDHLLDLFVINDKYHGNNFYLNNGTSFDDATELFNLGQSMESMSNSWSDMDNDLDYDVYISNSTQGNILMQNDDLIFTDVAESVGVSVNSVCWNALWIDFDHNALDDLHVATNSPFIGGNQNKLFRHIADGSFQEINIQGDDRSVLATAKGDIDQDGYWDIMELEQFPANVGVFKNSGGVNHWLKIALKGTVGNHDGVGVTVKYFCNGSSFLRHTFCGEGFLSQDSKVEILSLKSATMVDSLLIQWPSGWVDKYFDVTANQLLTATEGETFSAQIQHPSGLNVCQGDSLVLFVQTNANVLWFNGSTSQTIVANAPGLYSVSLMHNLGFVASDSVVINEFQLPIFVVQISMPNCHDSNDGAVEIIINSDQLNSILWENGEVGSVVSNLSAGTYGFVIYDNNNCIQSGTASLLSPNEVTVSFITEIVCHGASDLVEMLISGGVGNYSNDWNEIFPTLLTSGDYFIVVNDENNCSVDVFFTVEEGDELFSEVLITDVTNVKDGAIELIVTGGTAPYNYSWSNGSIMPIISDLPVGSYSCVITDALGCQMFVAANIIGLAINEAAFVNMVFPNPFDDVLNVKLNNVASLRMTDSLGRIVFDSTDKRATHVIATAALAPGIYFLLIDQNPIRIGSALK